MSEKEKRIYDNVIIGAGPAGLTAGLYAIRAGRSVLVLEQLAPGGQAVTTWQVDNYPGLPHVNGAELMMKMNTQIQEFNVPIVLDQVIQVTPGDVHTVHCAGADYSARTVIIATGAIPKKLGVPGEDAFRGRGVSYCATCDGAFFKDVPVAVVGGGNTALEEAEFLTRFASKVYLIHRRDAFRADQIIQDHVLKMSKIETVTPKVPFRIVGGEQGVQGIAIGPRDGKEEKVIEVKGVFIFTGLTPQTGFVKETVSLDKGGYIKTDQRFMTTQPGIFAVGDCRDNIVKQIIVAAGEGAAAAVLADKYLQPAGI